MAHLMSQSRVSLKIKLAEHIRNLDEDEVNRFMEQMKKQLECESTNEFLIKILIRSNTLFTNTALENMAKGISPLPPPPPQSKFLKMPDSIQKIVAKFMNEKTLVKFERCCRSTYTMVNTARFLRQSPHFKWFNLTMTHLNAILRDKNDYYKFSFANRLSLMFEIETDVDITTEWIKETKSKLDVMINHGREDYPYQSNWFTNMLKSMTTINYNSAGTLLLDCIPFDFEMKLKEMTFDGYWEESIPFESFVDKYSNYFANNNQPPLEFVRENMFHLNGDDAKEGGFDLFSKLNIIRIKHLKLDGRVYVSIKSFGSELLKSHLKVLSLENAHLCDEGSPTYDNMQIETLRLKFHGGSSSPGYLLNEKLIEKMNWQRTLKNLTIDCPIYSRFVRLIMESILKKEKLHKLENVNFLFWDACHQDVSKVGINTLFTILISHIKCLKHQFKQLNFGFRGSFAFQWSEKTNEAFLHREMKIWQGEDDYAPTNPTLYRKIKHEARMSCRKWQQQWCDGYC